MTDKQQALLTDLLQYHDSATDEEFVERVLGKAHANNRLKKYCLVFAIALAFIVSCILLLSITEQSMAHSTAQFWLFNGVLAMVLGVGFWVVHEDLQ